MEIRERADGSEARIRETLEALHGDDFAGLSDDEVLGSEGWGFVSEGGEDAATYQVWTHDVVLYAVGGQLSADEAVLALHAVLRTLDTNYVRLHVRKDTGMDALPRTAGELFVYDFEPMSDLSEHEMSAPGTQYRLVPMRPIGVEFSCRNAYVNTPEVAADIEDAIEPFVGETDVGYASSAAGFDDHLIMYDPEKHRNCIEYFTDSPDFPELVSAVAEVFESHGLAVNESEPGNLVLDGAGQVESQRMLLGSHALKTREAGRHDGSGRIDYP